jgi:hypothetical protein
MFLMFLYIDMASRTRPPRGGGGGWGGGVDATGDQSILSVGGRGGACGGRSIGNNEGKGHRGGRKFGGEDTHRFGASGRRIVVVVA